MLECHIPYASDALTVNFQVSSNLESIEECQHELKRQLEAANEIKEKLEQDQKVYDGLKEQYDETTRRLAEDRVEETFKEVRAKLNRFV